MTKLSPNFSLAELTRSTTAIRRNIDNTADAEIVEALTLLCVNVLEPVRAHFKKPVIVTSGYRSAKLNKSVGGSATSQHCLGEAADFTVDGVRNSDVCAWIRDNLTYSQCIFEFGENGWVHCSFSAKRNQKQMLSAKKIKGKTTYLPGIV